MTPAIITVNFISNYAGPHRICWRIQGSGNPYVCTNIVDCLGGGNTCQALINTMVDPELCDPIIFEGYIQATCNAEGSPTGQVPFTVTYTPDPSCKAYQLSNNTGDAYDFNISELGLNCDGTTRPDILLADGGIIYLCGIAGMPQRIIDLFNVIPYPNICCGVCKNYTVNSATGTDATIYYIDCTTRQFMTAEGPKTGDPGLVICAVEGSITGDQPLTIIVNGDC